MAIKWRKDNAEAVEAVCSNCGHIFSQASEWDMANLDSHDCAGAERGKIRPLTIPCDDCDTPAVITFEAFGTGLLAKWDCPECGISYDTNIDPNEVA